MRFGTVASVALDDLYDSSSSRTRAQSQIPFDLVYPDNQSLSPQPKLAAIEPRIFHYASRSDGALSTIRTACSYTCGEYLANFFLVFPRLHALKRWSLRKTVAFHAYVPELVKIARLGQ